MVEGGEGGLVEIDEAEREASGYCRLFHLSPGQCNGKPVKDVR